MSCVRLCVQTYVHMMNQKIQKDFADFEKGNPFEFTHIRYLKGMEDFMDLGPSVVFASPGMLQNGFSRQLFEMWCTEKKNGMLSLLNVAACVRFFVDFITG